MDVKFINTVTDTCDALLHLKTFFKYCSENLPNETAIREVNVSNGADIRSDDKVEKLDNY